MKKTILAVFLFCVTFAQSGYELKKIWESEPVLTVCESVFYNEGNIYVSCINGKPSEKNGLGFIAKLNKNGQIVKKEWTKGLNAPKGMALLGDRLFVTDIDRVVEISIKTGEIVKFYNVEGAKFLNDIAVDKNGIFYFSDSVTGKVHKLNKGKISEVFTEPVKWPNGILIKDNVLYVGGSGKSKKIFSYNLKTGKNIRNYKSRTAHDGLKFIDENKFLISDWKGRTYILSKDEKVFELLNTTKKGIFAADLEFIKSESIVIIPTFFDNRIVAYKLIRK